MDGLFAEAQVGMYYTKGYMGELSAEALTDMINSGNSFMSSGPEMRFSIGGVPMGGEVKVSSGESVTLDIAVSDDSPITSIKVYRFAVTGLLEEVEPYMLLDLDLTGQQTYSYAASLTDQVTEDCYYRVEATTEQADNPEAGIGRGYSNPVWVTVEDQSGNTSVRSLEYRPQLTGVGVLDAVCSAFVGDFRSVRIRYSDSGSAYVDATGGEFALAGLSVDTAAQKVGINFHKGAEGCCDFVTIRLGAADGSYTVKKLYIVR